MRKYIKKPLIWNDKPRHVRDTPPYSIPNVHLPEISVYDDLLDAELHKQVYEYLIDQIWYTAWEPVLPELQLYKPNNWDDSWVEAKYRHSVANMPRCMFSSDEPGIENSHPLIWKLWQKINARLDNRYEITGPPEGMFWNKECPPPVNPALTPGWRVYANASTSSELTPAAVMHRDNSNLEDSTTVTIIWMASPEWYPSWGGELQFFPEDPNGTTGDHQQFNTGIYHQQRNYKIGWLDQGRVVSLKPNRLLVYDGRTLHSARPTANFNNNQLHRRIVFRARLKQ